MGNLSPQTILIAVLGGVLPTLLWLRFWLQQDDHHIRRGLILICFVMGMITVPLVLPIERYIDSHVHGDHMTTITLWAAAEETIKYLAIALLISRRLHVRDTVDYAMYIITVALGFAAMENTFYLLHPEAAQDTIANLLTGNLRFLGATLLHSVTSAVVGIALGFWYYRGYNRLWKQIYVAFGLSMAIILHALFNFFIMDTSGRNFLPTFGFLWVATIIIILLFEKLRRMNTA